MKTPSRKIQSRAKNLSIIPSRSLYEKDFVKWAHVQANLLKKGEFDKLDIENLREEIEDLSKTVKRELQSYIEIWLLHQLKKKYQSDKDFGRSWNLSIKESAFRANRVLQENPSLKPKLKTVFWDAYYAARLKACRETGLDEEVFPEENPWRPVDLFPDLQKNYH